MDIQIVNENGVMARNKRKDFESTEESNIFLIPNKSKIDSLMQVP
jgi:hypothetical protein